MKRFLWLVVVSVAITPLAATPPAAAAACKAGTIAWKINGKRVCMKKQAIRPAVKPPGGEALVTLLLREQTRSVRGAPSRLPRRIRLAMPAIARHVARTVGPLLANIRTPAARSSRAPIASVDIPSTTVGGTTISGTATALLTADGTASLSLALDAKAAADSAAMQITIELDATKSPGCPGPDGVIAPLRSISGGSLTTIVRKGNRVVSASTGRVRTVETARLRVGVDARLERVDLDTTQTVEAASGGTVLVVTTTTRVRIPRSGSALLTGAPSATASYRSASLSAAGERAVGAEIARKFASEGPRDLQGAAGRARDAAVGAEPTWYALPTNKCTSFEWNPEPGAELAPGDSMAVKATLTRREDGAHGSARFTILEPAVLGSFGPTNTQGDPGVFTAVGGEVNDTDDTLFQPEVRAVGRIGRAQRSWFAKFHGFPPIYTGPVSQTMTFSTATTTFAGTATYTRTSQQTNPDGSRQALYVLSSITVDSYSLTDSFTGCEFTGSSLGAATIRAGDLEIQVDTVGAWTSAILVDFSLGQRLFACPMPFPSEMHEMTALLNTRTVGGGLRPMPAGGAITATNVGDVTSIAGTGATGSASWQLAPPP